MRLDWGHNGGIIFLWMVNIGPHYFLLCSQITFIIVKMLIYLKKYGFEATGEMPEPALEAS